MTDPTESTRRQLVADQSNDDRAKLEDVYGKVWTTTEMSDEFEVEGFAAPLVVVRRKSDNVRGTLYFQHSPRFYFNFQGE